MIHIRNVSKEYITKKGTIKGVDHVNLSINEGEVFGIVGYSGAGKSSLLRCINLLEKPTNGEIHVNGRDLSKLKGEELSESAT